VHTISIIKGADIAKRHLDQAFGVQRVNRVRAVARHRSGGSIGRPGKLEKCLYQPGFPETGQRNRCEDSPDFSLTGIEVGAVMASGTISDRR